MKTLPLTKGYTATVDDEYYEWLNQWKWSVAVNTVTGHLSAKRSVRFGPRKQGKMKGILMHRAILDAPPHLQVDHVNGDSLDNRRSNLRLSTSEQNSFNSKPRTNKVTSKYKGVWYDARYLRPWIVRVQFRGRPVIRQRFATEIEAALIYNKVASEVFGEFARLNVVESDLQQAA